LIPIAIHPLFLLWAPQRDQQNLCTASVDRNHERAILAGSQGAKRRRQHSGDFQLRDLTLQSQSHAIQDLLRCAQEEYRCTFDGGSVANRREEIHSSDSLLRRAAGPSHQPDQWHAIGGYEVCSFQDFSEFRSPPRFHQHVDIGNAYESAGARTPCGSDDLFDVLVERKGGYIDSDYGERRDYAGFCMEVTSLTIPVRRGMFHKRHDPPGG